MHVARFRAEDQLGEIRAQHLRYRPAETAQLLCGARLDVDAEQITVMLTHTEVAGPYNAPVGGGLRDQQEPTRYNACSTSCTSRTAALTDYLASEVLDGLPAVVRDVLRRVSISHVRAIYGKLGARSRRQAVAIAQRRGMV